MIPLVDLKIQYQRLKPEIDAAMQQAAADAAYILGPNVKALEKEIAAYCSCEFGVGVANGTDALHLALRALRIGPGDEVITTPFTFIATTEAIGIVGAKPVFVDIDPATFNIDPAGIEEAITRRTKAIMPVHLYGRPCEMDRIQQIARDHSLAIIEDAAQAIGAEYERCRIGSLGTVGCLSFFPSKNLGAFGDAGMIVTNNREVAERVEMLRRHGGKVKYHHSELGLNSRLDELQAAILRVKFKHLEEWTEARRAAARRYDALLHEIPGVQLIQDSPNIRTVYHQYTIRVPRRDDVQQRMKEAGVQTMVYYPVPLHLQEVHEDLGHKLGDFPHAENAADECLSLPMFPEITEDQQQQVADALRSAL